MIPLTYQIALDAAQKKPQIAAVSGKRSGPRGGTLLRLWRERRGLSFERAALELEQNGTGFAASSLRAYEAGQTKPRVDRAVRMRDVAGVPVEAW